MLDWGSETTPHDAWDALKAIDCTSEPKRFKAWLTRVLKRSPCPFPMRGMYFGLGEFETRSHAEYADLYFGLYSECDPTDEKLTWLRRGSRHFPDNAWFRSKPLKSAGTICNEDQEFGLSTPGYILFSVSFAVLLLRSSLTGEMVKDLGGTEPIGVVTGFDSGDLFRVGTLQSNGFISTQGSVVANWC